MIGELTGKVAGPRIIHRHHPGELKVERTIESKGKIPGTEVTFIATIKSWERPHGGIYAGGDGVMMTMNGDTVMLQGSGISVAGKGAGLNMRGARLPGPHPPPSAGPTMLAWCSSSKSCRMEWSMTHDGSGSNREPCMMIRIS